MPWKMYENRRKELAELAEHLGVQFHDLAILDEALTHSSYANEMKARKKDVPDNERLEFLGDAVLELAMSTYLYRHFPDKTEGTLSKIRASLVRDLTLSHRAEEMHLGEHLLLGHGESMNGGAHKPSLLENTFEAVIGAIYLDQGWEIAEMYVLDKLKEDISAVDKGENRKDYKTMLQEEAYADSESEVVYELVGESGPDHDKRFEFVAKLDGKIYGHGKGRSKKEAEQQAAKEALEKLRGSLE